jgi:hypothetical protein
VCGRIRFTCHHRGVLAPPPSSPSLSLSLSYSAELPSSYAARIGESGWLEGWGWTIDEALASLATRVCELQPSALMQHAGRDHASILAWLSADPPVPMLAE